jgi:two-component system, sensor histidine kinase RegB
MADVPQMDVSLDRSPAQAARAPAARGRIRLGTLNNLRWLGVVGQTVALVIVYFVLGYDFGLTGCVVLVGASAVLNIVLAVAYPAAKRLNTREATAFLSYDILQLAALLYLTGGIENPFALLFLAPVVISAASLDLADTLLLGGLSFGAISFLANFHRPLPWLPGEEFHLPALYRVGIWISLLLGIGFTSVYAWRISREASRMSAALSATQLALAREHRLAALGALAAAAAHELGTPLATIAVVARELERELPKDSPAGDDFRLLRDQAERCRAILTRLARPEEAVAGSLERMPLGALLDDIAAPHRGVDVGIVIELPEGAPPKVWRAPEILHGLGNLIENAADFAAREVRLRADWNESRLTIEVADDGPGFIAEIMERIGEPYVTSRPSWRMRAEGETGGAHKQEGMGLGFFIAKTLIEQTGGTVTAQNLPQRGASVTASWPRGAIDGAQPPSQEFWL